MAKGNNVLKYVGVVAIVYVLSKGVSKEIIRKNTPFRRVSVRRQALRTAFCKTT